MSTGTISPKMSKRQPPSIAEKTPHAKSRAVRVVILAASIGTVAVAGLTIVHPWSSPRKATPPADVDEGPLDPESLVQPSVAPTNAAPARRPVPARVAKNVAPQAS